MSEIERLMELKRNGLLDQIQNNPEDLTWLADSIRGFKLTTSTPIETMLYVHELQQLLGMGNE